MPVADRKIEGGCLCGSVRYEADRPPFRVGYCHCRRCQRAVGNIFGTAALFDRQGLRFGRGEITWYRSSASVKRGFCAICGAPIAAQHGDRDYTAIWLGSLDDPARFEPSVQWYRDTKIPWVSIAPGLPDETGELAK